MGKRGPKPKVREEVVEVRSRPTTLEEARERKRVIDEELARLDAKDLEVSEQERVYKEQNKIEFFEPIDPYQTKILEHLHSGKKVITLQGANSIGKTVLGVNIIGSACLGIQPWDRKETVWGRKPVKCRILCSDWEKHARDVIVPKLKEWLPKGEYETTKNNLTIESHFIFKNGSTIELVTNKQDTEDLEGWDGNIVWGDEPFNRDKFVALLRGLRKAKENLEDDDPEMGVFLITMTAVKEAWMLDDIVRNTHRNYASVTEIPMNLNPYLSKDYQETYEASLKENEKIPRIQGGWLNLVGLIWPDFKPDIHLIDDFKIPTGWPVVPFIDFHYKLPHAFSFYTADPQERRYVIDERWEHLSPEETADLIIRAKTSNAWNINEAFIDPLSKGDTVFLKNRMGDDVVDSFNIIKERLGKYGIELNVATKDKASGILNIEKMLMGPNKMPILFFFRSLTNKIKDEGTIWEIQRWTYDENQKPKDENDHFMENLYRMSLVEMKYYPENEKRQTVAESDFDIFNPRVPETENRIEAEWR